jgi:hypothetical protein
MSGAGSALPENGAGSVPPTCSSARPPYESSPTAGSIFIGSTLIHLGDKNVERCVAHSCGANFGHNAAEPYLSITMGLGGHESYVA